MYLQVFWNIQFQDRKFKEGNLDVKTLVSKLQRIPLLLLHKNPTIVTAVNHLFLCLCGHGSIVDYHPMQISSQTSHKSPGPSRLLAEQILIICPDKRLPHWSLLVLYCLWCIYSVSTQYLLNIYSVSTEYLLSIYTAVLLSLHWWPSLLLLRCLCLVVSVPPWLWWQNTDTCAVSPAVLLIDTRL